MIGVDGSILIFKFEISIFVSNIPSEIIETILAINRIKGVFKVVAAIANKTP
jgi:hypothetical protein